jgi:putative membrane protein
LVIAMPIFDTEARQRIETAIARVEQHTAAEIVVIAVPASDRYHELRALYGSALALASAAVVHWVWPGVAVVGLLWLEIGVGALGFFALGWAPLLRLLVPRARALHAVERRAREKFLEHEIFATRDRSGVLLLLSELEQNVVILGDVGIHGQVQQSGWQQHVERIVAAIRAGRPADGVCEVISALGEVLAAGLPQRADDRNELPNAVEQDES